MGCFMPDRSVESISVERNSVLYFDSGAFGEVDHVTLTVEVKTYSVCDDLRSLRNTALGAHDFCVVRGLTVRQNEAL
jgi:hypothetical protein